MRVEANPTSELRGAIMAAADYDALRGVVEARLHGFAMGVVDTLEQPYVAGSAEDGAAFAEPVAERLGKRLAGYGCVEAENLRGFRTDIGRRAYCVGQRYLEAPDTERPVVALPLVLIESADRLILIVSQVAEEVKPSRIVVVGGLVNGPSWRSRRPNSPLPMEFP